MPNTLGGVEVGTVADWFGAVGTIGACWIALHLARKQSRANVSVNAFVWGTSDAEVDDAPTKMYALDVVVTNHGYQPFAVNMLMIKVGWNKPFAVEVRGGFVHRAAVALGHAESVRFTFPLAETHASVQRAIGWRTFGWIERRLERALRVEVVLSSGESRDFPLNATARRYLLAPELPSEVAAMRNASREPEYHRAATPTEQIARDAALSPRTPGGQ